MQLKWIYLKTMKTSRLAVMKYNISQKFDHVTEGSMAMTSLNISSTFNATDEDHVYHDVTPSIAAVINATESIDMDDYQSEDPSTCYRVLVDCHDDHRNKIVHSNIRTPSSPKITIKIVRLKRQSEEKLPVTNSNYY